MLVYLWDRLIDSWLWLLDERVSLGLYHFAFTATMYQSTCSLLAATFKWQTPKSYGRWGLINWWQKEKVLTESSSFSQSVNKYLLHADGMPGRDIGPVLTGLTIWCYTEDTGTTIPCGSCRWGSTRWPGSPGSRVSDPLHRGGWSGRAPKKNWLLSRDLKVGHDQIYCFRSTASGMDWSRDWRQRDWLGEHCHSLGKQWKRPEPQEWPLKSGVGVGDHFEDRVKETRDSWNAGAVAMLGQGPFFDDRCSHWHSASFSCINQPRTSHII